jgi:hypothetical protein
LTKLNGLSLHVNVLDAAPVCPVLNAKWALWLIWLMNQRIVFLIPGWPQLVEFGLLECVLTQLPT